MGSKKLRRRSFLTAVSFSPVVVAIVSLTFSFCLFFSSCGPTKKLSDNFSKLPLGNEMVLGTYAGLPRLSNGRADLNKLLKQLKDLNANTYNWLIWQNENDWDDLKLFLPIALKNQSISDSSFPTGSFYCLLCRKCHSQRKGICGWCTHLHTS